MRWPHSMSEPRRRVAALACSPPRPPQKLGGLPRWDDYVSESGAQHVNFPGGPAGPGALVKERFLGGNAVEKRRKHD